jgi:hypothetical protein
MPNEELLTLLTKARAVLENYLVEEEGQVMRDDVAQICMEIDDVLPDHTRITIKSVPKLERAVDIEAA